jgi:hypothetical protein
MTIKEHYRENYYNGKRNFPYSVGIWWRRATGKIPLLDKSNKAYDVISVINPQPNSIGIISYSLFGDGISDRFRTGLLNPLLNNAQELKDNLPGWVGRIYISEDIPSHIIQELVNAGYELFIMPSPSQAEGYVWRFLATKEDKPVIVHDADMKFVNKELKPNMFTAVEEWLKTDKPFLRRKLHISNFLNITPIRAGCWGTRPIKNSNSYLSDIKETLEKYKFEGYGSDEAFLTKEIWPLMKKEGYYSTGDKGDLILGTVVISVILFLTIFGIYLWRRRQRI